MASTKRVSSNVRLYTKGEFLAAARLSSWQVRGWLREGVLSRPIGRGPGTRYTDEHVAEAKRIREVLESARSYRYAKEVLDAERAARSIAVKVAPAPTPAQPPVDGPLGEPWEMISILPGVVVGVARSVSPETRRTVQRMLAVARER